MTQWHQMGAWFWKTRLVTFLGVLGGLAREALSAFICFQVGESCFGKPTFPLYDPAGSVRGVKSQKDATFSELADRLLPASAFPSLSKKGPDFPGLNAGSTPKRIGDSPTESRQRQPEGRLLFGFRIGY